MGLNYASTITNSYATGNVSSSASAAANASYSYAGGLVGYNRSGTITNSYKYSGARITENGSVVSDNSHGEARSQSQFRCPTSADSNLGGTDCRNGTETSYAGLDPNIWNFGGDGDSAGLCIRGHIHRPVYSTTTSKFDSINSGTACP